MPEYKKTKTKTKTKTKKTKTKTKTRMKLRTLKNEKAKTILKGSEDYPLYELGDDLMVKPEIQFNLINQMRTKGGKKKRKTKRRKKRKKRKTKRRRR